ALGLLVAALHAAAHDELLRVVANVLVAVDDFHGGFQYSGSTVQLMGISATLAEAGNSSARRAMRATSSGWVARRCCSGVRPAAMSVATKPGHSAVQRTRDAAPQWRMPCASDSTAALLSA